MKSLPAALSSVPSQSFLNEKSTSKFQLRGDDHRVINNRFKIYAFIKWSNEETDAAAEKRPSKTRLRGTFMPNTTASSGLKNGNFIRQFRTPDDTSTGHEKPVSYLQFRN
ncbi:MAG: hypothetical protein IIW85_00190, partial [Bacteroidaceae bacterium]|nr:hypothetical protein [Bacteroidaceae bacterium]